MPPSAHGSDFVLTLCTFALVLRHRERQMAQVDPDHKEAIRQQLESYRDVNLPQETQLAIYSKARVGLTDDMEGKYPGRRHWGNRSYIVPGHLTNNEVAAIHARWEDWTVGFDALLFMLDLLPSYTEAGASQVKAAIELTLAPSVSRSKTFVSLEHVPLLLATSLNLSARDVLRNTRS